MRHSQFRPVRPAEPVHHDRQIRTTRAVSVASSRMSTSTNLSRRHTILRGESTPRGPVRASKIMAGRGSRSEEGSRAPSASTSPGQLLADELNRPLGGCSSRGPLHADDRHQSSHALSAVIDHLRCSLQGYRRTRVVRLLRHKAGEYPTTSVPPADALQKTIEIGEKLEHLFPADPQDRPSRSQRQSALHHTSRSGGDQPGRGARVSPDLNRLLESIGWRAPM